MHFKSAYNSSVEAFVCSLSTLRAFESLAGEEEGVEESKCTLQFEEQRSSSAREGAPNINGR